MKYMIFNSQGAADNAQHRILKLWSQYLSLLGYDRNNDFVVSSGFRGGVKVPVVTSRWSSVQECVEGWAIAHPEVHTFEDGTLFSIALADDYSPEVLAQIGITPTPNLFGASYTEAETITPIEMEP